MLEARLNVNLQELFWRSIAFKNRSVLLTCCRKPLIWGGPGTRRAPERLYPGCTLRQHVGSTAMDARLGPYDTDYQGLWLQLSESWPLFHHLHIAQDLEKEFENISVRGKLKRGVLSLRLSRGSPIKVGLHQRRSRSRNQKRRTLRSSENGVQILLIPLTTPSFTIK